MGGFGLTSNVFGRGRKLRPMPNCDMIGECNLFAEASTCTVLAVCGSPEWIIVLYLDERILTSTYIAVHVCIPMLVHLLSMAWFILGRDRPE